jgi:hypothetical protein
MNRRTIYAIAVVLATLHSASAQPPQPPTAQLEAMKKLDFLVGEWKGEGWMEFGPGQRREFKGSESVHSKCDGILLTIDGLHHSKPGDAVVHNAFAVLSFDPGKKQYRFEGFTSRGNRENSDAIVGDKQLVWSMKIPNFGTMRYTIKLDDKGRWFEIGEISQDGVAWRKFFEMTMEKVEAKSK